MIHERFSGFQRNFGSPHLGVVGFCYRRVVFRSRGASRFVVDQDSREKHCPTDSGGTLMRHSARLTCVALVAGLGLARSAAATPIYYSEVLVQATDPNAGGTNQQLKSGIVLTDTLAPLTATNGKALATAFVTDGVLGAYAWAQSLLTDNYGFIGAVARASFIDTLTLTSSTLAIGTLVDMLITLDLNVVLASTQTPNMGGGCGSSALGSLSVYSGALTLVPNLQDLRSPAPCQVIDALPLTIHARIGDELRTVMTLHANAGGRVGGGSSADATHSLRFYADPLGDFGYVTASGNAYLSPSAPAAVPEPSAVLLLASGLVALVARSRCRNGRGARGPRLAGGTRRS